jgi:hypothetical protein
MLLQLGVNVCDDTAYSLVLSYGICTRHHSQVVEDHDVGLSACTGYKLCTFCLLAMPNIIAGD